MVRNRWWLGNPARGRLASLVAATILAAALGASPAGVGTVHAAGPLRVAADATYTLDPEAGRVHVAVSFRATNLKAPTSTTIYYWRDLAFAIQPDAKAIRASDDAGDLSITTRERRFYVQAEVHLRANLYYQQSTTFTIRYDLVGGAPRSASPIRVGQAFATFGVWAWGDDGRSTVEVRTPRGFGSRVDGDAMQIRNAVAGQTLVAEPADPGTFYSIVSAENRAAYGSTRISLPGEIEVVVLSWPEDDAWEETVSETLEAGIPVLLELIGLDWPVDHDLDVRERYTPALEGYAGIFFNEDQRIEIGEDLDPALIVHEASHAWFDGALFHERWVYEGLAQEYAWRVLTELGRDPGPEAERPDLDDPGFTTLGSWEFPEVIRDQETDDRERYGYQAAYWVIHGIVEEVGVEQMRAAFAAADANRTAYPGAGEPEAVSATDSWKRLLDLVEPPDEPTSAEIEGLLRDYVLRTNELRALTARSEAREAYRDLLAADGGWLPGWYVRQPLEDWRFDLAEPRMEQATEVLALRDRVAAAAQTLDLEPDDALRTAYEGATEGLGPVLAIGEDQLEALTAIEGARAHVEAEPDLLTTIGLMGETPPATSYVAARESFERGELDLAVSSAAAAVTIVTGAAAVGQQRVLVAAVVAAAVMLLLIALVVALRRRRRGLALALAGVATSPWPPDSAEPYATLAADPAAPSPQIRREPTVDPPDLEGGPL